jgi:hypothetical protein
MSAAIKRLVYSHGCHLLEKRDCQAPPFELFLFLL